MSFVNVQVQAQSFEINPMFQWRYVLYDTLEMPENSFQSIEFPGDKTYDYKVHFQSTEKKYPSLITFVLKDLQGDTIKQFSDTSESSMLTYFAFNVPKSSTYTLDMYFLAHPKYVPKGYPAKNIFALIRRKDVD